MGKLAELAGAKSLTGKIRITCMTTGVSRTCDNEVAALSAIAGSHVEHRRGAFFYGGEKPKKKVAAKRRPARTEED